MVQTLNFTLFIGAILVTSIAISKEIFIFNDESLVVLCFIVFVLLTYKTISNALSTELKERSNKIQIEFDNFYTTKKELLLQLVNLHKKQQKLTTDLWELIIILLIEKVEITNKQKLIAKHTILNQLKQKLDTILTCESNIVIGLQQQISLQFSENILNSFSVVNTDLQVRDSIIKENIEIIKNL